MPLGMISVETPKHEVLLKTSIYEIRKYAACIAAETSSMDTVDREGFRALAKVNYKPLGRFVAFQ